MTDDAISRTAAIETIRECKAWHFCELVSILGAIKAIPSAQPKIVRCKDCKYKQQCRKAVEHITHEPTSVSISCRPIDFCSYGEKRSDG